VAIETNDFNKPTDESRAVEKFIRLLIANNELSLARNILEALGEKYSYLLFELEVQAGNYKRAVEIYNYLPKDKHKIIYILYNVSKTMPKMLLNL